LRRHIYGSWLDDAKKWIYRSPGGAGTGCTGTCRCGLCSPIDQQIPVVKIFDSQGSGDAQYELWCETHDWLDTEKASATSTMSEVNSS